MCVKCNLYQKNVDLSQNYYPKYCLAYNDYTEISYCNKY